MKRAGIYARISLDPSHEGAGVKRQIADCRNEADRRGLEVVDEYVDNDMSAYSGKRRPEYERLLADIESGRLEAVIVYHVDRLHRRPIELEQFHDVAEQAGMHDLITVHGDFDLGSGDGMLVARMLAAVAANESAAKSRRVRRKMEANALEGRPHGTRYRPFGYEPGGLTINEAEAQVIRDLVDRFLAGETIRSLVRWLNESEFYTVGGKKEWHSNTVRTILRSGRIAGLREHRGQVVAEGQWPAIITVEKHEQLRRILDDPSRRVSRGSRRYLLAGMLRCAICGRNIYSRPPSSDRPAHRYSCKSDPSVGGCGRVHVAGPPLEDLVVRAVLMRLDTPDLADALTGRYTDSADAAALAEELREDQSQLEALAGMYGSRSITAKEWHAARKPVEQRIQTTERRLSQLTGMGQLANVLGKGEELRMSWSQLNLDRQRAIVSAVLDHAVIKRAPNREGRSTVDPDRVTPVWRL